MRLIKLKSTFYTFVGFQQIQVCYKKFNKIHAVWDSNMKLIQKFFHGMINKSVKFQGCSSMHIGITKYLDVPVFSVTVGKTSFFFQTFYSFYTFVVWITFRRKEFECIKKEIGRLVWFLLYYRKRFKITLMLCTIWDQENMFIMNDFRNTHVQICKITFQMNR